MEQHNQCFEHFSGYIWLVARLGCNIKYILNNVFTARIYMILFKENCIKN
jgi:hypothetical protein